MNRVKLSLLVGNVLVSERLENGFGHLNTKEKKVNTVFPSVFLFTNENLWGLWGADMGCIGHSESLVGWCI